jgi:hypothetical protein
MDYIWVIYGLHIDYRPTKWDAHPSHPSFFISPAAHGRIPGRAEQRLGDAQTPALRGGLGRVKHRGMRNKNGGLNMFTLW